MDSAVDVAKEAADIVLLDKDLGIFLQGVREGRKAFANTLKYVFMATSANFGNRFSMAGLARQNSAQRIERPRETGHPPRDCATLPPAPLSAAMNRG